ncbi:hypothetical protein Srut_40690 [Streptomyces rutgersensis]|nr:hypothetical protein Srut_40690 [Streptomyces rutgersensis]
MHRGSRNTLASVAVLPSAAGTHGRRAGRQPGPPPLPRRHSAGRPGHATAPEPRKARPPLRRGEQRRTEATPGSGHRGNGDRPNAEDKEQGDRPSRRTTGTA